MSLEVQKLASRRGARLVLRDVSFEVAEGAILVLRGPNGAGKSSLIRVLAGLAPPDAGDARFGGRSLGEDPGEWREAVAYVGHQDAVKPALSVAENLSRWAQILSGDAARVEPALERLGLSALADAPAGVLSAGNRRRLGLARLLVTDRRLWLLDEPTVSLDVAATAVVAGIVSDHLDRGGVAVAATHIDLGIAGAQVLEVDQFRPTDHGEDPFDGDVW